MNILALCTQYDLQTSWFLNALEDISDEESNIRISSNLNPIKWVAGHLLNSRYIIVNILTGRPRNEFYYSLFKRGSSNVINNTYPSILEIKEDWINISQTLMFALRNASEESLLSPSPFPTTNSDGTILGLVAYFGIHEDFHIGQLSVLRKLIGKEAMLMNARES